MRSSSKTNREFKIKSWSDLVVKWPLIKSLIKSLFEAGKKELIIVVQNKRRNNLTNSKFHAMLEDIRRQGVLIYGSKRIVFSEYSLEVFKTLIVVWFAHERDLNGEPLANPPRFIVCPKTGAAMIVRPSTADDMCQRDVNDLIEYCYMLSVECNVALSEPALKAYAEYPEVQKKINI